MKKDLCFYIASIALLCYVIAFYYGVKMPDWAGTALPTILAIYFLYKLARDLSVDPKVQRTPWQQASIKAALFLFAGMAFGYFATQPLVIRTFNQISYKSLSWLNCKWLGVPSWQNPCDNWVMQEIIFDTKPDFIIETGTASGGTTLFYAMVLDQVNPNGKIITIDVEPHIEDASQYAPFKKYVETIVNDSTDPALIEKLENRVRGSTVLVTLDSLHQKEHVLKELRLYSKLVSPDSYLVVQDTNINGHPVLPTFGPGPMEAVKEFLADNKDFKVDRNKEKYLLTHYPSGFLKRVR